jgi:hypothetical protein
MVLALVEVRAYPAHHLITVARLDFFELGVVAQEPGKFLFLGRRLGTAS